MKKERNEWTKPFILTLLVGMTIVLNLNAQTSNASDRWGKHSSISEASSTLNGVKPLASWIWDSGEENPKNYYLLVRKTFKLKKLPKEAITYISAYAYADVYINGKLVERCPMNCDPEYQCYDKFNIASYLQEGENCISGVVQNFGVGLHSQINARGGFFFQSKLDFADGSSTSLLSDDSWKVTHAKAWKTETPYRDPNARLIGFIEEFDARLWPDGWHDAGFNDSKWEKATVIGIPPVSPWNSMVVTERPQLDRKIVRPIRKWKTGNLMVYDFGTEITGYPQFSINSAREGIQIEVGTGERLDSLKAPKLRVSSDHSEKYTTKKGLQSWRPYTWSGFRYFSMETDLDIQIQDVSAEFSCYNYEMVSSFECSDPQLNEKWEVGKHTMRINSIDTYQDPWREHTQYIAGDSRYMQIYGNYAFGESARFLSAYNLLCGAQSQRWREDGAVRSRYPTDYFMQPGSSTYLADYQLEWVLMMREYFMYFGKDELIENLYPNMKKAVDYYLSFVDEKTGLLTDLPGWIVLDWPSSYSIEKKNIVTGLNCLYYGALNAAAAIASDFANDNDQAERWLEQARRLKENINRELWSEKDRAYLDSYEGTQIGQQTQVYALNYGLPDESRKEDILKLMMERGKSSEQSYAYWTLYAMFTQGNAQWALDYLRKNWGEQMQLSSFNGAWHEGWDLSWGATSHAWSSGPTALLPQKVLGVEPTGYGWKSFAVKPNRCDLMWAKGKVSTVAGDISVSWEKSKGSNFVLKLNVPQGTTASVYLPTTNQKSVKVNGKTLDEKQPLVFSDNEEQWEKILLKAGEYQIECEIIVN
ncbi:family 78 glycoside hydrolase catalytic domain [Sunxiuqinia sp. A32]|uniref:family 78 glycoside hydrolase catalytic domain n=1 Tax=Sunxiuqinia sp. A32 TaxID=3461496 RepID=UPI00404609D4